MAVGLGGAHDGEHALTAAHVDGDGGADVHGVGALRGCHDGGLAQDAGNLGDARLEHALLVFRVVVLGVLGDVAELARHLDALAHLGALLGFQIMQLLFELLLALGGKNVVISHVVHLSIRKKRYAPDRSPLRIPRTNLVKLRSTRSSCGQRWSSSWRRPRRLPRPRPRQPLPRPS